MTPEELYEQYEYLAPATVQKMFSNPKGIAMSKNMEVSDLIQTAKLSLWKSCLQFDETKGRKFINFAITKIRWDLIILLRKHPLGINFLHSNSDDLKKLKKDIIFHSMDAEIPTEKDSSMTYHEIVASHQEVEGNAIGNIMMRFINSLPSERWKSIVRMKLMNMNNSEIGRELGISREWVRKELYKIQNLIRKAELV